MLRQVGRVTAAGAVGGSAYGYYWANKNMGEDAVNRIVAFDKVCVPMIVDYKWEEAKCEKLPKLLPALFPAVSEQVVVCRVTARIARPCGVIRMIRT